MRPQRQLILVTIFMSIHRQATLLDKERPATLPTLQTARSPGQASKRWHSDKAAHVEHVWYCLAEPCMLQLIVAAERQAP